MQSTTFTIVTPSWNQSDYIGKTIESVLGQKGDFMIQYIIADGGSDDGSVEVIKKYAAELKAKRYPVACRGVTLQWWSKKDKGQSDAINQGLKIANGDFVAYLNSDDVYFPGALEQVRLAFEKHKDAGGVYSDFVDIDERGEVITKHKIPDFDIDFEIDGNIIPQPAMFMRRSAQQEIGYFNETYHYAMDYDMWVRLGRKYPIHHINAVWAGFRLHGESKTVSQAKNFWREEREISRKNGGRYFSRLYIHHMYTLYPRATGVFIRLSRLFTGKGES